MSYYHGDSKTAQSAIAYGVWAIGDAYGDDFQLRWLGHSREVAERIAAEILGDDDIDFTRVVKHNITATEDDLV